jgi:hypothetical protein
MTGITPDISVVIKVTSTHFSLLPDDTVKININLSRDRPRWP